MAITAARGEPRAALTQLNTYRTLSNNNYKAKNRDL